MRTHNTHTHIVNTYTRDVQARTAWLVMRAEGSPKGRISSWRNAGDYFKNSRECLFCEYSDGLLRTFGEYFPQDESGRIPWTKKKEVFRGNSITSRHHARNSTYAYSRNARMSRAIDRRDRSVLSDAKGDVRGSAAFPEYRTIRGTGIGRRFSGAASRRRAGSFARGSLRSLVPFFYLWFVRFQPRS